MCTWTRKDPVESPENEDESQPNPGVPGKSGFFGRKPFGFEISYHGSSVHPDEILIRDHGVSAKYIVELRQAGFQNLDVEELMELTNRHITPRFVREMRREYGDDLGLAQLLE